MEVETDDTVAPVAMAVEMECVVALAPLAPPPPHAEALLRCPRTTGAGEALLELEHADRIGAAGGEQRSARRTAGLTYMYMVTEI
ncbi:hypothetical protein Zm00014a_044229 [Zea mays]|uniref:Uncharacterized protein n=1 Tax=Zea mays TaxID=4577 RepID=A0A3L6FRQ8_MAIZE|nr:hypothetical protein Zm00014a_044229 [Zea mays]